MRDFPTYLLNIELCESIHCPVRAPTMLPARLLQNRGSILGQGRIGSLYRHIQPPIQRVPLVLPVRMKWPKCEADLLYQLPRLRMHAAAPLFPIRLHGAGFINHVGNFTSVLM
jgi:hypothetical protein